MGPRVEPADDNTTTAFRVAPETPQALYRAGPSLVPSDHLCVAPTPPAKPGSGATTEVAAPSPNSLPSSSGERSEIRGSIPLLWRKLTGQPYGLWGQARQRRYGCRRTHTR